MSKGNDGTWLQDALQKALKAFCGSRPGFWHRFPDSKSSRTLINAQPGDYLWVLPWGAVLIECKSTDRSSPLRSLLDPGQCGKHRLWHRAGQPSAFVYADSARGLLQWHDGKSALEGDRLPEWAGSVGGIADMLIFVDEKNKHE